MEKLIKMSGSAKRKPLQNETTNDFDSECYKPEDGKKCYLFLKNIYMFVLRK